jgi:hypothetical protein
MSRELPTTLFRTLTSCSRSIFERGRGEIADGSDIRAGRHALIARIIVWLVRLTQMSRTRSCPNRRLVCLALESPPDDVAFEMPPNRHRISPSGLVQLLQRGAGQGLKRSRTAFLTAIGSSCTPENTLLLSVR